MPEYTPNIFPEITAHFNFLPGEPQTHWDPGCDDEVEFTDIEINGEKVGPDLETDLLERHGDDWEADIIRQLDEQKANILSTNKKGEITA